MKLLVRQRLADLLRPMLLPVLGLVMAAAWLGYSVASQLTHHPAQPLVLREVLVAVLPALLMLLVLAIMAHSAARKAMEPWVNLAQAVRARHSTDLRPVEVNAAAPTEVLVMADALNRLFARANAESDAQQRFIADAAHQLRTPLAALQSQVEAWTLMAQAAPTQSIVLSREQVERLRRASRRTTQLANQLLVLSRVDSGLDQGAVAQRVDVKSLCEALFESFLDAALNKNLDLGLEASAAHVTGQEWLLREMISNILDNAIKYTPHGGQVTLRCGRRHVEGAQSPCVYVEVEDNGPGVPPGEYERLTQRFYRVAGSVADGSGLGLAIVQEIAQAHAAKLSFKPGSGSCGLCVLLLFKE